MKITSKDILDSVRDVAPSNGDEIKGPSKIRHIVRIRHACFYLARKHGASFPDIGQKMGGKDHSSVMYGVSQCREMMGRDKEYAAFVAKLEQRAMERRASEQLSFRRLADSIERGMITTFG